MNGQEPVRTPLKETQDVAEDRDIWASLLDRPTSPSAATHCWEGGGPRLQCEISRTSSGPRELILTLLRIANTGRRTPINRRIFTAFKPIYITNVYDYLSKGKSMALQGKGIFSPLFIVSCWKWCYVGPATHLEMTKLNSRRTESALG